MEEKYNIVEFYKNNDEKQKSKAVENIIKILISRSE